ncbi:30S ribosomal protein S24e [uncultured archaeon]|nr:30S ribosomal protein S24e [uncultured archaeon]
MELAIKNKEENKLLGLQTLTCEVSYEKAVPSRKQIREAICAASGVDPSLLVIASVNGEFGSQKALVIARAYATKEALAVEKKHLLVRDGLAQEEEKKKEAKAPAKK